MKLVVKVFAEITIKSRPVRKNFIRQLRRNIRNDLRLIDPEITVSGEWDNLQVETQANDERSRAQLVERLKCIPGVANFLEVWEYPLIDIDTIYQQCREHFGAQLPGKTFAVRCKRAGKHEFTSQDVERYVGGGLNQHCGAAGVELRRPELLLRIEIRHQQVFIVRAQHAGIGGYPLGTMDQVLTLMSGGFDSTVAAYQMLRRGLTTHFVFFNLGGRAHELGVKEVAHFIWQKYARAHKLLFVTVPFEGVVGEILSQVDNSQMGVVLKRMMLRAATQVADELEIATLVTGEAVGQVSSQTLPNLGIIDRATDKLVLRPLVVSHKQDIIDTADAIGTGDYARNMPEYCGVISVNPTTRACPRRIAREEEKFDMAVLEQAVSQATYTSMSRVIDELSEQVNVEMVDSITPGQVLLDIRHPDEIDEAPLTLPADIERRELPFYAINSQFKQLDENRQYLLYCSRGVMSRLHAQHLVSEGFTNVRVYRPAPQLHAASDKPQGGTA